MRYPACSLLSACAAKACRDHRHWSSADCRGWREADERIDAELRGFSSEARIARMQERSAPLIADMRTWLTHHRTRVAGKSPQSLSLV
jgi:hypothetical protein